MIKSLITKKNIIIAIAITLLGLFLFTLISTKATIVEAPNIGVRFNNDNLRAIIAKIDIDNLDNNLDNKQKKVKQKKVKRKKTERKVNNMSDVCTYQPKNEGEKHITDFINQHWSLFKQFQDETSVPAVLAMAQFIEESHCGLSFLGSNYNNFTGIKEKINDKSDLWEKIESTYTDGTVKYNGDGENENFYKMKNPWYGMKFHFIFLQYRMKMYNLSSSDVNSYYTWIDRMTNGKYPYAANPKYGSNLKKHIAKYGLNKLK